jgi:hypothetical protein
MASLDSVIGEDELNIIDSHHWVSNKWADFNTHAAISISAKKHNKP